jgi:hypothetical protein
MATAKGRAGVDDRGKVARSVLGAQGGRPDDVRPRIGLRRLEANAVGCNNSID